jgi:aspartate/methionine/tyrosine aminotransferase
MNPTNLNKITSFLVMDILEKAHALEKEGKEIIHLEVGEPDFATPACIKEAANLALKNDQAHYTHSQGIIELREAICRSYQEKYQVSLDPEQIFVTQGTSPGMLLVFSLLLNEGDKVIISDPAYACYPNFIHFSGASTVRVPIREEDGFQLKAEILADYVDSQVKAIVINSPSNPTGTLLSAQNLQDIAAFCLEKGLWIISDEIYHGLVYAGQEHSALEYTDQCFVLNGFSKLYAMTGWRLGYIIAPHEYIVPLRKLCQNFFISANSMAQWAGIAALNKAGEDVEKMRQTFDKRRKFMLGALRSLGFKIICEPSGAFYILVNARHLAQKFGGSSLKLALDILYKAGVGVTPGIDFGPGAEGYLRFSYANSMENIAKAMDKLGEYLRRF